MNKLINYDYLLEVDKLFGRLGLWMYSHKLVVFVATTLLLGTGVYFASKVLTDNSFTTFFNEADPAYSGYLSYQEEFGSDEVAYLLYSVPKSEHGAFDLNAMQRIAELTEMLEYDVPFVKEVTSLSNVEFIAAEGDFLEIHELGLDMPADQASMLVRRNAMLKKPAYLNSLMDSDATHGAIILEMNVSSSDLIETLRLDKNGGDALENLYPQATNNKINEILSRPEFADIHFYKSGDVPMNSAYNEIIGGDAVTLTLATLALVTLISLMFFRGQLLGIFGPLTVVLFGLVLTVGFMGLVGYKIGALFLIVPTLLIAIGVAQSIHLITEFNLIRSEGASRTDAVKKSLEHVATPCLLAAITTACGFLVMAGSNLQVLAELAIYIGVGVLATFIASISVMVCFMSLGSDKPKPGTGSNSNTKSLLDNFLGWVVKFNVTRPWLTLIICTGVLLTAIVGVSKLQIGFNFLKEFKPSVPFYQDTHYVQDKMGGILSIIYIYESQGSDNVKNHRILSHLDQFQSYAEQSEIVNNSYSLTDLLKDMNQSFNGDDPNYYRLPESEELIAQYLLLYEISGGKELSDYLNGENNRTSLELRVDITDSHLIAAFIDDMDNYLQTHPLDGASIQVTGIGLLWVKIAEYVGSSQLWGYGLAFTIIALILCIAFRSIKVGMLAMIPNLFPIVLTLGLMGWLSIHLDYLRLLLATVAIGIAVDDTVHITSRLRKEFLLCGNYEQAINASLMSVGRALIITTVILSLSFLTFLLSSMALLASFGILLCFTIAMALIADLFLLPSLVLVLKPFGPERNIPASEQASLDSPQLKTA